MGVWGAQGRPSPFLSPPQRAPGGLGGQQQCQGHRRVLRAEGEARAWAGAWVRGEQAWAWRGVGHGESGTEVSLTPLLPTERGF